MSDPIKLLDLPLEEVPPPLRIETYFDMKAHPFAHEALFQDPKVTNAVNAIHAISGYVKAWLSDNLPKFEAERKVEVLTDSAPGNAPAQGRFRVVIEKGAVFNPSRIIGADGDSVSTLFLAAGANVSGIIYLDSGSIYVGEDTLIEDGSSLKGPTIIGKKNEIRGGSYFRGNLLIGDGGTFRGELKNVVMFNKANFPHPGYVGDSLCGYMSHFGNQATAANLGIFAGVQERDKRKNLVLKHDGKAYDLGGPKLGIILGDFSQVGCNSVADPGTFLAPYTIVYQLTRINKGFYGPNVLLKNKPIEHGVVEITELAPLNE